MDRQHRSTDLEEGEVDEEEHEGWFCEPEVGVADLHQRDALDHGVPLRDVDGHAADDALQLRPHGQDDHHRHDGHRHSWIIQYWSKRKMYDGGIGS